MILSVLSPSQDKRASRCSEESLAFWFVPLASGSVTGQLRKELALFFLHPALRCLCTLIRSLSSGEKSCSSQHFSYVRCSSALIILCWILSSVSVSLLHWDAQNRTRDSRHGLASDEQRRGSPLSACCECEATSICF